MVVRLIGDFDLNSLAWPLMLLLVVPTIGLAWAFFSIFFWIDGGVVLYRYYPIPQVLAVTVMVSLLLLLFAFNGTKRTGLHSLLAICLLAPFSLSLLYGDATEPQRRDFLLKAHSIAPGDPVSEVERLLDGFNRSASDPASTSVSYGVRVNRNTHVGVTVYLTKDRTAVKRLSFSSD
ncbi:MAG: hypothetical protein AAF690_21665 [Acidobacteriota bacterium]